MKKLFIAAFAVAATLALTSCEQKSQEQQKAEETIEAVEDGVKNAADEVSDAAKEAVDEVSDAVEGEQAPATEAAPVQ